MSAVGYIVVTFGSEDPDGCDLGLTHCPMSSYGPFGTSSEAWAYAATYPAWTRAHVLILDEPTPWPPVQAPEARG